MKILNGDSTELGPFFNSFGNDFVANGICPQLHPNQKPEKGVFQKGLDGRKRAM